MLLTWRDNRNNKQDNYIYYRKEGQVKLTSLWSRTKEYEKEAQVRPDEGRTTELQAARRGNSPDEEKNLIDITYRC